MSKDQKIDLALTQTVSESALIAYYKGLGYSEIGKGFYDYAIFEFRNSMTMDVRYEEICKRKINKIYRKLDLK